MAGDNNKNGNKKKIALEDLQTMTFLDVVADKVLPMLRTEDQKRAFAKALKLSITTSLTKPPVPCDAQGIEVKYGFNKDIQKSYFLALNKQLAKIFLTNHGATVDTKFDIKYNIPKYKEVFGKNPTIVGTRSMLLTYAEWLHLVGYDSYEPDYPAVLEQYLK